VCMKPRIESAYCRHPPLAHSLSTYPSALLTHLPCPLPLSQPFQCPACLDPQNIHINIPNRSHTHPHPICILLPLPRYAGAVIDLEFNSTSMRLVVALDSQPVHLHLDDPSTPAPLLLPGAAWVSTRQRVRVVPSRAN
jgi:hypothetical protein